VTGVAAGSERLASRASTRAERSRWSAREVRGLALGLGAAVVVRLVLLPAVGYRYDMDQFVIWTHGLAIGRFGDAYRMDLSFPPVMVYVFGILAALEAGFRTATDATDTWIRILMKVPGSLADLGLAVTVAFALRRRPGWAVVAGLGVALHPAALWVSGMWGQYDSVYVLAALVAFVLAASDRPIPAAVALSISVMTKPEAVPFLVPFGAWCLARQGFRVSVLAAAAGAGAALVLWAPFLAAGGPAAYLGNLAHYQGEVFTALSLRAWNFWWLIQQAAGGGFTSDSVAIAGPLSARTVGFLIAGLAELVVFLAVWTRPTSRTLALGLACSTLVAFGFLTTMHERYAYGALVFLALLIDERPLRWIWVAFGVLFTLDIVSAIPTREFGVLLPNDGAVGIAGSLGMLGVTAACLWELLADSRRRDPGSTAGDSAGGSASAGVPPGPVAPRATA
jgi:Gpi18-like mannosyltransferase